MPDKPLGIQIAEALFDEIVNKSIPEGMRQNMLLVKEMMTLPTGKNEQHLCLFFRAANMMTFFRQAPRFVNLLNASSIRSSKTLIEAFKQAGILAFHGKEKEKGIPYNPAELF